LVQHPLKPFIYRGCGRGGHSEDEGERKEEEEQKEERRGKILKR